MWKNCQTSCPMHLFVLCDIYNDFSIKNDIHAVPTWHNRCHKWIRSSLPGTTL